MTRNSPPRHGQANTFQIAHDQSFPVPRVWSVLVSAKAQGAGTMTGTDDVDMRASRSMQLYLAGWCLLATAAIGYIGYVAYAGDDTAKRPAAKVAKAPAANAGSDDEIAKRVRANEKRIERISRDMRAVKKRAAETEKAVEAVRSDVSELQEWRTETFKRIDVGSDRDADARPPRATNVRGEGTAAVVPAVIGGAEDSANAAVGGRQASLGDAPNRIVGITVDPDDQDTNVSPLDVGLALQSATQAVAPLPAVPLPARPQFGVELARGPSREAIRLSWDLMTERHGPLLAGLDSRYVAMRRVEDARFRLIAGPVTTLAEAVQLCARLASVSLACRPTAFSGAQL